MREVTIGARITEEGVEFFGMDDVNAAIQAGGKVVRIEEGQVLVEEVPEEFRDGTEDEEGAYTLAGFEIVVTMER